MVDGTERDAIHRGNLLELASLLTTTQFHLVPEGLSRSLGVEDGQGGLLVSPRDVQNVHEYRGLLEKAEQLLNECAISEEWGRSDKLLQPLSRILVDQHNDAMEDIKTQLCDFTARTRKVHFLWTRFEVWWTKLMAQHFFVVPTDKVVDDPSRTPYCCFSPLLNLPGSKHFSDLLPEAIEGNLPKTSSKSAFYQNIIPCCSLALPPNKHTWQEFARISCMVALLDKKNAENNPCAIHDLLVYKQTQEALGKDFSFAPAHLIALWVRGQRNTQAMRHLWMLFEVHPQIVDEPNFSLRGSGARRVGKQLVVDVEGAGSSRPGNTHFKPRSFQAVLRGNPNYTRTRVVELSSFADQLVQWCTINQVLYTHMRIQKHLLKAPLRNKKRKSGLNALSTQNPQKKLRRDFAPGSDLFQLQMAGQAFVLRWFARRNRATTSLLFTHHAEKLHLDLGSTDATRAKVEELKADIEKMVKLYLAKPGVIAHKGDRFFDRVDRRLGIEGRYSGATTMADQVGLMLTALEEARSWKGPELADINNAKNDIQVLYNHFFSSGRDIYEVARDIIDVDADAADLFMELIDNAPKPWPDSCWSCSKDERVDDLFTCINCERICHHSCCSSRGANRVKFKDVVASYEPLHKLCQLKRTKNIPIPDYTVNESLNWDEMFITIQRSVLDDGKPQKLGLVLRQSEECSHAFESLQVGSASVADLAAILNFEDSKSPKRMSFPMLGIHRGVLVVEAREDPTLCGRVAGVCVGDIIVAVEHLEVKNSEQASAYSSGTVELSDMNAEECLNALKVPSTKLRLTVLRPSRDIVQESRVWYSALKRLNKTFLSALRNHRFKLRFCDQCSEKNSAVEPDSRKDEIVTEAERSRAVVRRIGFEGYGLPFLEEDVDHGKAALKNGETSDGVFVSLRRLDAIMTFIMDKNSPERARPRSSSSVMLPPWALKGRTSRRLKWAPEHLEDKPAEILCRALLALESAAVESDEKKSSAKKDMLQHFLLAFTSWCVLSSSNNSCNLNTKGPPEWFRRVRQPWLQASCAFCHSQARCDDSITCDNESCIGMLSDDRVQMRDIDSEVARKLAKASTDYNLRSSLVGKTLLVLPEDPLVESLNGIVSVDHCDRPIEFIIVSYVPTDFVSEASRSTSRNPSYDKFEDNEGVFHLLPILSTTQMKFILERCRTRRKYTNQSTENSLSWVGLDVLNIAGVARFSFPELLKKLVESNGIKHSIDVAVAGANGVSGAENCSFMSGPESTLYNSGVLQELRPTLQLGDLVATQKHLVDSLLLQDNCLDCVQQLFSEEPVGPYKNGFEDTAGQERRSFTNPCQPVLHLVKLRSIGRKCQLFYSDLHCASIEESQGLEKMLNPEVLGSPPLSSCGDYDEKTFLLYRDTSERTHGEYKGIGFGFELVQWVGENKLRVGRVHRQSPASSAGVKPNDIVLSAGGKDLVRIPSQAELLTTILGVNLHVRICSYGDFTLKSVLSAVQQSGTEVDSVVLVINRPSPGIIRSHGDKSPAAEQQRRPRGSLDHLGQRIRSVDLSASPNEAIQVVEPTNMQAVRQMVLQQRNSRSASTPQISQKQYTRGSLGALETAGQTTMQFQRPQSASNPNSSYLSHRPPSGQPSTEQDNSQYQPGLTMDSLRSFLQSTSKKRVMADLGHLYRPAGQGTMLTLMEASVFLECTIKGLPKLGLRLLSPRYGMRVLYMQVRCMASWSYQQVLVIPRISKPLYQLLLCLDHKRATNTDLPETGPPVFQEQEFLYRLPVDILPIDREIERALRDKQYQQEVQHFEQHYQREAVPCTPNDGQQEPNIGFEPPAHHFTQYSHGHTTAGAINLAGTEESRESDAERIRGGGPSPSDDSEPVSAETADLEHSGEDHGDFTGDDPLVDTRLTDLLLQNWVGLPIHSLVAIDDAQESEAKLVGWVKSLDSPDGEIPETVEVEGYYLATIGYFDQPRTIPLYSDEIFVVREDLDTEEAAVIKKLRAQGNTPGSIQQQKKASKPMAQFKEKVLAYVKQLGNHMNVLGETPDGRQVLWVSNDPAALYIAIVLPENLPSSNEYLSILQNQSEAPSFSFPKLEISSNQNCCQWGCSTTNPQSLNVRTALGFVSIYELKSHYDQCHAYGSNVDQVILGGRGRFSRISEGRGILEFNSDVSSAIIACSPKLWSQATKESVPPSILPSGVEFAKSPSGERLSLLWSNETLKVALSLTHGSNHLQSLLNFWSRLGRLFEINGSGLFRLQKSDMESAVIEDVEKEDDGGLAACRTCQLVCSSTKPSPKRLLDCSLCSLPWEKSIGWTKPEGDSDDLPPIRSKRGIGCASLSDASFRRSKDGNVLESNGALGEAKSFLFRLADLVPSTAKVYGPPVTFDPIIGHRIWEDDNFNVWKAFVMDCSNPRMLCQAFTVLLASIHGMKLPRWWRQERGGWSTAQMIMANTSLPTLFLHLYVLDAAIAETIGNACSSKPEEQGQKRPSVGATIKRMAKYLQYAKDLGFPRFVDGHNSYCMFCDDGGDLLCCELCSNVQHTTCCDPPINRSGDLDWVCDSCINDICHKKGIDRKD